MTFGGRVGRDGVIYQYDAIQRLLKPLRGGTLDFIQNKTFLILKFHYFSELVLTIN